MLWLPCSGGQRAVWSRHRSPPHLCCFFGSASGPIRSTFGNALARSRVPRNVIASGTWCPSSTVTRPPPMELAPASAPAHLAAAWSIWGSLRRGQDLV